MKVGRGSAAASLLRSKSRQDKQRLSKSRSPRSLETAVGSRIDGIVEPADLCSLQIASSSNGLIFPHCTRRYLGSMNFKSKSRTKQYLLRVALGSKRRQTDSPQ